MNTQHLGRYQLTEQLAIGGTAEIFKAKLVGIEGFEKTVVIKRILPHWSANRHFITMLIDEAKIMVKLNHEKIVQVYELGKEGENYYIVMEYISGIDLRKLSDQAFKAENPLTPSESIYILCEILRGLDYIHRQKDEKGRPLEIVHRDISPHNILISEEGEIKIADFGIAHATSRSYETATGVLKGKFSYMSPEQARGGIVTAQTDLFATGIIFYELMTGKRLFSGGSDLEVLERVRNFNIEKKLEFLALDSSIKKILKNSLKLEPKERYLHAQEFLRDLQEAQKKLNIDDGAHLLTTRLNTLFANKQKSAVSLNAILPPLSNQTSAIQARKKAIPHVSLVSNELLLENKEVKKEEITSSLKNLEESYPFSLLKNVFHLSIFWKFSISIGLTIGFLIFLKVVFWFSPKDSDFNTSSDSYKTQKLSLLAIPESLPSVNSNEPISQSEQKISRPFANIVGGLGASDTKPLPKQKEKTQATLADSTKTKKKEEKKQEVKTPDLFSSEEPVSKSGKGLLSVKGEPYGVVSIVGHVNGSEKPVARILPYGNYQVQVSYRGVSGNWKTLSRSVKVAKASTFCIARFNPEGQGSIACR